MKEKEIMKEDERRKSLGIGAYFDLLFNASKLVGEMYLRELNYFFESRGLAKA